MWIFFNSNELFDCFFLIKVKNRNQKTSATSTVQLHFPIACCDIRQKKQKQFKLKVKNSIQLQLISDCATVNCHINRSNWIMKDEKRCLRFRSRLAMRFVLLAIPLQKFFSVFVDYRSQTMKESLRSDFALQAMKRISDPYLRHTAHLHCAAN